MLPKLLHCSVSSKCSILAIRPSPDQNISRSGSRAGQEVAFFPDWGKSSTCGSLEEDISELVMSGYPVSILGTAKCMVTHLVAGGRASRAGTLGRTDGQTKPAFEGWYKLGGAQVQTKGWLGDHTKQLFGGHLAEIQLKLHHLAL